MGVELPPEGPADASLLCNRPTLMFKESSQKLGDSHRLPSRFLSCFIVSSQEEAARRGVYSPQDHYTFPATRVGTSSALKVNIRNNSSDMHEVRGAVCSGWAAAHGGSRYPPAYLAWTLLVHTVPNNCTSAWIDSY